MTCDEIREILPDRLHGALTSEGERKVREHLRACRDCREEMVVLEAIFAGRPEVPVGLEAMVAGRLRAELGSARPAGGEASSADPKVLPLSRRRPRATPLWALSAAAMLVLALGTGVIWSRWNGGGMPEGAPAAVTEAAPESWLWDDGLVAGGPVFDGLSEEALETLLEEMGG